MQDYKDIMKTILAKYYEPTSIFGEVLPIYEATTDKMLRWFRGVIPENPIDEHDVYGLTKFRYQKVILKKELNQSLKMSKLVAFSYGICTKNFKD